MVEINLLPLVKLRPFKLHENPLLSRSLLPRLGRGPLRKGQLPDPIALITSFKVVLVFELLQISQSNLLVNKSLDELSAGSDSQSFYIVFAFFVV